MVTRNLRDHIPVFKETTDAWTLGTSGVPITLVAGTPSLALYITNAGTSASVSAEGFYVQHTLTGAAQVGGRARFHLAANAALGGWSNALKGSVTYSTAGSTSGLGSAICAELTLSAGTTSGTYAPLESEIVVGASGSLGTATSFLYMNFDTTGEAAANAGCFLFELGSNVNDASGEMYDTSASGATGDATLKIKIDGTTKYLLVADDAS